ncbi:MAG: phenylalanine--tRNA ligase subunit beta [Rickettsiales bacterium]
MKFTLSWLKSHLETEASLQDITDKLTAIGLEVENVEDKGKQLADFTVAKIIEAEKHPKADKLKVCKVESDEGILQIVCGAANARAGIYVALAKEGSVIPTNGMIIKKSKIRDVESRGMLCSEEELGIAESSEGIIELPEAGVGTKVAEVLGLNDPVIEIAITPNRADCLGVHGIARDLAASGIGRLKPLTEINFGDGNHNSPISVTIEEGNACKQFIGCHIKNVNNIVSPDWLKKRLESIGQKSISALVDITNYFTFDLGRPLHVYDADKLNGNINVRLAKDGEKILALDDKEYGLSNDITVIADEKNPVAIGGIIGGSLSGCSNDTKNIFLEVALFEASQIANSGRILQIDSDARYRFERGVDVAFVEEAAKRAASMITEICGGVASKLVYAGKTPDWKKEVKLDLGKVKKISGIDISAEDSILILKNLGFSVENNDSFAVCTPPSWRADIENDADLIEEIVRIYGYENIPTTPLPKNPEITKSILTALQKRIKTSKRLLAESGMLEVKSWSFLPSAQAKIFGGNNDELTIINPINAELDTMRPSILPNMLEAAKRNRARGFNNLSLFEIGLQFHGIKPEEQQTVASGIYAGKIEDYNYANGLFTKQFRDTQTMDSKKIVARLLATLGVNKFEVRTDNLPKYYHPNRSGAFVLGKNILAYFGEINPIINRDFDFDSKERIAAFEVFLENIPQARNNTTTKPVLKLSDYQTVERDFAFTIDDSVSSDVVIKEIGKADKNLINNVEIFDIYSGKGIAENKKSVAVKVSLQPTDKTLSEQEIAKVSDDIIKAAEKGFGGVLRN